MKNYINIVWEGQVEDIDEVVVENVIAGADTALLENETEYEVYESDNETVLTIETHQELDEEQSNAVANKIANKLFDLGYTDFNIEISV